MGKASRAGRAYHGGATRERSSAGDARTRMAASARRDRELYQLGTRGEEPEGGLEALTEQERQAWEAGEEDAALNRAKPAPAPKRSSSSSAKKPAAKRYARSSAARRRAQRLAKSRSLRQAARIVARPAATKATTAGQVAFASIVVVALYVALTNAGPIEGVLGGVVNAIEWLRSPEKSIPAKPGG